MLQSFIGQCQLKNSSKNGQEQGLELKSLKKQPKEQCEKTLRKPGELLATWNKIYTMGGSRLAQTTVTLDRTLPYWYLSVNCIN